MPSPLRRAIITGDLEVAVPPNFPLEIAHTLVKAVRRGRFPADELDNGVQAVLALELLIDGSPDLPRRAARLAHRLGTSAYDAAYLVTARSRDATLITADRPLYDAGLAAGFDVAWLADVPA